ncbi:MAG: Fe-S cluster assembly ATPase SufC [Elusimicrobia bacterium]|nr:Fe-S cluster assembly ATPase SufC [Candidatus Obscuribacterium magneticum]
MADNEVLLKIDNLFAAIEGKTILKGIDLTIKRGEVHAIMGPNGSGKSTLSNVLMGHPKYVVTEGTIHYRGEDLTGLSVDERARRGLFLAFQYPLAIPGVPVSKFLWMSLQAAKAKEVPILEFRKSLKDKMAQLGIDDGFLGRYMNDGFSGGEKKRHEILQLMVLEPTLAILDETDSGLDIDALKVVAGGVERMRSPERGFLIITHYQRILNYVQPDVIHVLADGRIIKSGGKELALELEKKGYDWILQKA